MEIKDMAPKAKELRGHFSIELIDKNTNEIIDSYEDNNLIVNKARSSMAKLIANYPYAVGITGFKMGTQGHDSTTDNILKPKEAGQQDYDESREKLFSQESNNNAFFYTVTWDPKNLTDAENKAVTWTNNNTEISFVAKGQKKNQQGTETDAENAKIPIKIELGTNSVKYTFEIPENYMNGTDGKSAVAFTEAGLFCKEDMFSIKCFPAKVKDSQTLFRIHWRIIF